MYIRVLLGMLFGFVMGILFLYWRIRSGLSRKEWYFLQEFYDGVRAGNYEINGPDEISQDTNDEEKGE